MKAAQKKAQEDSEAAAAAAKKVVSKKVLGDGGNQHLNEMLLDAGLLGGGLSKSGSRTTSVGMGARKKG
jgi:hypothetical protein